MQDDQDKFTKDILGKPRRGRPADPNAKTAAQRKREQRARLAEAGFVPLAANVPVELSQRLDKYIKDKCGDVTKDEVVKRALEAFFRKR